MSSTNKIAQRIREFPAHSVDVTYAKFGRKSGQLFASGADDGTIKVWNLGHADPIANLEKQQSSVSCLAFNDNEEQIIAGSVQGSLRLWSLDVQKIIRQFSPAHRSSIETLDFHPFGEYFASGSFDLALKVWDIRRKKLLLSHKSHRHPITQVKFTPDGCWIVSGDEAGTVLVYDLRAGKCLHEFQQHDSMVTCLDFHPCEFLLASGSKDKTIKFWDLEKFQLIASTDIESSAIKSVRFSEDGTFLMSATNDSLKAYTWEPSCQLVDSAVMPWQGLDDILVKGGQVFGTSHAQSVISTWNVSLSKFGLNKQPQPQQQLRVAGTSVATSAPTQSQENARAANAAAAAAAVAAAANVKQPDHRTEDIMNELNDSFNKNRAPPQAASKSPLPAAAQSSALPSPRLAKPSSPKTQDSPPSSSSQQQQQQQVVAPSGRGSPSSTSFASSPVSDQLSAAVEQPRQRSRSTPQIRPLPQAREDVLVPMNFDKPLGLDVKEFLPEKYERNVLNMTDADLMAELLENHDHIYSVMASRLSNMKIIRRLWSTGEHKEATNAVVKIGDHAIAVDFLKQVTRPEISKNLTLDMCVILLPLLCDLCRSKLESHVSTAINAVSFLYKSFQPTFQANMQPQQGVFGAGVDLSKEARVEKCRQCIAKFQEIQALLDQRFSNRNDDIGVQARQFISSMASGRPQSARTNINRR